MNINQLIKYLIDILNGASRYYINFDELNFNSVDSKYRNAM